MGKMEYQCPCGARVEYAGVMTRCTSCGRRLDPLWKRVQDTGQLRQERAEPEYDAPRRAASIQETDQQEPIMRRRRAPAEAASPTEQVHRRSEPQKPAEPESRFASVEKKKLRLEYQGRALDMPDGTATGELGRDAIGAEVLAEHRLVSRVHVRFSIDRMGRLFVLDQSKNGTWITHDGTTRPVSREHLEILAEGDTLWLYDVPLVVRKDG